MTIYAVAIACTAIGYSAGLLIKILPTPTVFLGTRELNPKKGRHTA